MLVELRAAYAPHAEWGPVATTHGIADPHLQSSVRKDALLKGWFSKLAGWTPLVVKEMILGAHRRGRKDSSLFIKPVIPLKWVKRLK